METTASSPFVSRIVHIRQQLTTAFTAARQEYATATRQGRGGGEVQARYAARMDGIVEQLAQGASEYSSAPVALCAIGGYGRRRLCLHSDVDLLMLFEQPLSAAEERFLN